MNNTHDDRPQGPLDIKSTHPDAETEAAGAPRNIRTIADIKPVAASASRYIVKGLIGPGELGGIFAPAQLAKTFFATNFGLHVVLGRMFHGRRVRSVPVLAVMYEGSNGYERRIEALAADLDGNDRDCFGKRFAFSTNGPFLGKGVDGDKGEADLRQQIADASAHAGEPVGLVFIDTLAKAIGGESLNDDGSISAFQRRLTSIARDTGVTFIVISHPGHNAKDRPAGAYASIGGSDFLLEIKADGHGGGIHVQSEAPRSVIAAKVKDGEPGQVVARFRLKQVDLGRDADGDPITSCVIEHLALVPADQVAGKPKSQKFSPPAKLALDVLKAMYQDGLSRIPDPAEIGLPQGQQGLIRVVNIAEWRSRFMAARPKLDDENESTGRQAFKRAVEQLASKDTAFTHDLVAWIKDQAQISIPHTSHDTVTPVTKCDVRHSCHEGPGEHDGRDGRDTPSLEGCRASRSRETLGDGSEDSPSGSGVDLGVGTTTATASPGRKQGRGGRAQRQGRTQILEGSPPGPGRRRAKQGQDLAVIQIPESDSINGKASPAATAEQPAPRLRGYRRQRHPNRRSEQARQGRLQ